MNIGQCTVGKARRDVIEDLEQRPPPYQPANPLWDGVYTFVGYPSNFRMMALLWLTFFLLALIANGFAALFTTLGTIPEESELSGGAMIVYRGSAHVFTALCLVSLLCSLCPSACLVRVMEATAAGGDDVDWSADVWLDWIGKFLYLLWVFGCCMMVAAAFGFVGWLLLPLSGPWWWALLFSLALILFPIALFSTLTAGSAWMLVDGGVL